MAGEEALRFELPSHVRASEHGRLVHVTHATATTGSRRCRLLFRKVCNQSLRGEHQGRD